MSTRPPQLGGWPKLAAAFAFCGVLWAPQLQQTFGLLPALGLGGVESPPATVGWRLTTWHDGSWQAACEARFDHEHALRDWLVRLDNELRLRVFGVTRRPVVRGPGDWLVDQGYLPAIALVRHKGRAAQLLGKCLSVRLLADVLAARGISLMVLVSPNKVLTCPERLPDEQRAVHRALRDRPTQYDVVRRGLAAVGVPMIDCVAYARRLHAADLPPTPPMFVTSGIHWSNHGAARCAAFMLDEVERLTGRDVRGLTIEDSAPGEPDRGELDIARLANVLDLRRWRQPLVQPLLRARDGDESPAAKLLLVGTSFLWGLARALKTPGVAEPLTVYYYYRSRTDYVGGEAMPSVPLAGTADELRRELPRYEVVVIEASEGVLNELGGGFIEAALVAYGVTPAMLVSASTSPLASALWATVDWDQLR